MRFVMAGQNRRDAAKRVRLFLHQLGKAGHLQSRCHFGRWPGGEKFEPPVFHLAVILEQHPDPRRTKERGLGKVYINRPSVLLDSRKDFDFKLIRRDAINSSGQHELPTIGGDLLSDFHMLYKGIKPA